jgi:hypothetical protein
LDFLVKSATSFSNTSMRENHPKIKRAVQQPKSFEKTGDFPDCSRPCERGVVCEVSTVQRTPVDLVRRSEQLWTVHPHDPHGAAPRPGCSMHACRSVVGRRARSRDGDLLCPAHLPGAPPPLAANGLIGINSIISGMRARGRREHRERDEEASDASSRPSRHNAHGGASGFSPCAGRGNLLESHVERAMVGRLMGDGKR